MGILIKNGKQWFKFLAATIICLFFSISAVSAQSNSSSITVCASGCNYASIQVAVNVANASDIINVSAGIYNENVDIIKSINIIGSGAGVTIVNALNSSDYVFEVTANSVNISGFTVTGATGAGNPAGVYVNLANNTNISNNAVIGNRYGIFLQISSNNQIRNNTASDNTYGIHLKASGNNSIQNNNISSNNEGIFLDESSNGNTIRGNTALNNGIGIELSNSGDNTISDNNASNSSSGIYIHTFSNNNTLSNNTIYLNSWAGIYLVSSNSNTLTDNIADLNRRGIFLSSSNNNTLTNNVGSMNTEPGIYFDSSSNNMVANNNVSNNGGGIYLSSSSSNVFINNTANSNGHGIHLSYSDNNTLTNNTADSNTWYGIFIYSSSNYNIITGNNANSNNDRGITISSSDNNAIYHNNFINNTNKAYDDGNNTWHNGYPSGGNYWGGWTSTDSNGDGIVDLPYNIRGWNNQDRYPVTVPYGWLYIVPDTTPPLLTIDSPINTTYTSPAIDLNVSADEAIDTWTYSLDGGTNATFTPNIILWWNSAWQYKKRINITNNNLSTILENGYTVNISVDTATLISEGKLLENCNDLRIVHNNTEFDRINTTRCNNSDTQIWFKTQDDVNAGSSELNYYIYYGNPDAGVPLANPDNIYLVYDDFSGVDGDALDSSKWGVLEEGDALVDIQSDQARFYSPEQHYNDAEAWTNKNFSNTTGLDVSFDWVSWSCGNNARWRVGLFNSTYIPPIAYPIGQNLQVSDGCTDVAGYNVYRNSTTVFSEGQQTPLKKIRFLVNDDWAQVYKDDILSWNGSWSRTQGDFHFLFYVGGGGTYGEETTVYFDNVKIRKYIEPGPITSLGGEELVLGDGAHNVTVYASDTAGNLNSVTVYFTIDATPPLITIDSPTNTTYTSPVIYLNVSADKPVDTWTYSLDGGSNVTFSPNTTLLEGSENSYYSGNGIDYRFVDLSPYVNHDATSAMAKGYSNLPIDTVIYSESSGTPFKVFSNGTNIFLTLNGSWSQYPSSVNIDFNDYASAIYFIGHVHAQEPFDAVHGNYTIKYADGSFVEILLDGNSSSSNYNIDDHCCNWRNENLTAAFIAWEDYTQSGKPALIREFRWENPKPELKIDSITFGESGTVVSPMLFAVTYIPLNHVSDGPHNVTVYASDTAGNMGSKSVYFTVDTSPTLSPPCCGGGGGGGGGHSKGKGSVIKKIVGGKKGVAHFDSAESPVSEITLMTKHTVYNVRISVENFEEKPYSYMANPPGMAFKYLKITKFKVSDSNIKEAEIKFPVDVQWLSENDIDPDTVHLYRYKDGKWGELDTELLDADSEHAYFTAITPGFSHFSIAGEPGSGYLPHDSPPKEPVVTVPPVEIPVPLKDADSTLEEMRKQTALMEKQLGEMERQSRMLETLSNVVVGIENMLKTILNFFGMDK